MKPLARAVVAGLAVVAVAVVVLVFVAPRLRRSSQVDSVTEAEDQTFRDLVGSDDPALDEALVEALGDGSRGFRNRVGVAKVLLRRRAGFGAVERALREGDLSTRTAALAALQTKDYFHKQILADPAYRVRETVLEWVRREGDASRRRALVLLQTPALKTDEALPAIRQMIALPPAGATLSREDSDLRRTAVDALRNYVDCGAAEALLAVAHRDPDPQTRLRAMQAVAVLSRAKEPACEAALPESKVVEVVGAALDHPGDGMEDRSLRLGAMAEIARTPAWGRGKADRIRSRLAAGIAPAERRQALETLVRLEDAEVLAALPRYFHDADPEVRHSAAAIVAGRKEPAAIPSHGSLLAGFVRDERSPGGAAHYEAALARLQSDAGEWLGIPKAVVGGRDAVAGNLRPFIARLYKEGRVEEKTPRGEVLAADRDEVARLWFRHVARRAGLDAAKVDEAQALRDRFWEKARSGDAAGARAVLEGSALAKAEPEAFLYETGWLLARG